MDKEKNTVEETDTKLCARGKNAAKARYDKYPSAYANGHAVQVCKGKVAGLDGKKKVASGYKKSKGKPKNEEYDKELFEAYFLTIKQLFEDDEIQKLTENEVLNEAEYRGRKVKLNKPFRDSSGGKKFAVYVKSKKGNVKKVRFGASGYRVRNNNKSAAKNFRKRHNCKDKKDKTKAGYWACRISRYAKSLGLSSKRKW